MESQKERNKPKPNPARPRPRQEVQVGPGQAGGLKDQGENPPPGQPKEMGQESLTCCAGPLGPDAWVLL